MKIQMQDIPKIYDFWEANSTAEIFVIAGGRSKGATWGIADKLIEDACSPNEFILCTREIKGTVDHSSRRTIEQRIKAHGMKNFFEFKNTYTKCKRSHSEIIYTGLSKITEDNIQGLEGLTKVWLGEAHTMELSTWQKFEPTVRDEKAIIYIDYNTQFSHTPIHMLFTENPETYPFIGKKDMPELAYLFMDYTDNIYCPEKILRLAERNKTQYSIRDWNWIWKGHLKDASERYIVNDSDMRNAMNRVVELDDTATRVVGCDIAHMGGDEITFYQRRGNKFLDEGRQSTHDRFNVTCDELESYIQFDKASILVIDNGHLGCAVADEMEHRGYSVERVNFGGTKEMHKDPEHCKDCATDMAFNFAKMLPKLDIPRDETMSKQITQRRWSYLPNGKAIRKIESKKEFATHAVHLEGHTSPDRGDAMWLACYNSVDYRIPSGIGNMLKAR